MSLIGNMEQDRAAILAGLNTCMISDTAVAVHG